MAETLEERIKSLESIGGYLEAARLALSAATYQNYGSTITTERIDVLTTMGITNFSRAIKKAGWAGSNHVNQIVDEAISGNGDKYGSWPLGLEYEYRHRGIQAIDYNLFADFCLNVWRPHYAIDKAVQWGKYDDALKTAEAALSREMLYHQDVGELCGRIGDILREKGQTIRSNRFYEKGVEVYREGGLYTYSAHLCLKIEENKLQSGLVNQAKKWYLQAFEDYSHLSFGDAIQLAMERGDTDNIEKGYEGLIQYYLANQKDYSAAAKSAEDYGDYLTRKKELEKAKGWYEGSLMYLQTDNKYGQNDNNISYLSEKIGDLAEEIEASIGGEK